MPTSIRSAVIATIANFARHFSGLTYEVVEARVTGAKLSASLSA